MAGPRVIVAGAGLSGLACAFDLVRGGADVLLLEAGGEVGGVVGTTERDGFRFETGPSTIQAGSENFRRLCGDLGIADRLIASSGTSEERYLFVGGRLRKLPASPIAFLGTDVLSFRGRMRVASEILRRFEPPPAGAPEPDAEAFFRERLGPEAARVLAGSFVRGVYAAELTDLGARSAFPKMWKACVEHGGLVRGLRAAGRDPLPALPGPNVPRTALLSFPEGLHTLVRALEGALAGRIRTRERAEEIAPTPVGWSVRSISGTREEAEHLVLAVPAPAAARLLERVVPHGFPIDTLRNMRHAAVTLVHVGLSAADVPRWPPGFGYLVPPAAGSGAEARAEQGAETGAPRALGTILVSNLFPGRAPEGCVALSSFYQENEVRGLDERRAAVLACEDFARALGDARVPRARVVVVRRWSDVIPRYSPGHADRIGLLLRETSRSLPGVHLAGSYVAGVSVDQVIARGRATAREILG